MVIILSMKNDIKALNRHIMQLTEDLKKLSNFVIEANLEKIIPEQKPEPKQELKREIAPPPTEKIFTEKFAETFKQKPAEYPVNTPEVKPVAEEEPIAPPLPVEQKKEPAYTPPPHSTVQPTPQKGFNFERFIGENLINKIGIGVLVIGIGLFVKYAIENGWINEVGRVAIGFLCGAVLLAFAYRFRKLYRAFSSVLAGGGIVVFYFTVAIAFREYNIFGQTTSFLLMVVITGFSVWLSIQYDRRELAILSLIGGLLTPFTVSRGDGNYHVLFTYIAILDIGILTLSLRKQWRELIIISFIGTQLIFWLFFLRDSSFFGEANKNITRDTALLIYTTAFYIIFLLIPLVQVFRGTDRSKNYTAHIITLLGNSFFYLLAGVLLLQRMDADNYKGLLTALLAVVNFVLAMLLRNNQKDKILFHLFVGLTIGFVTLVAPMQFNSNNNVNTLSLFWATEAVLLLWLFRKSNAAIFYYGSLILLGLTLIGILILHSIQYASLNPSMNTIEEKIFINKYFITRLYVSLAFVIYRWQLLRRYNEQFRDKKIISSQMPPAIGAIAVVLLFYTGINELYLFTDAHYTGFWTMAYSFVFVSILSFVTKYRKIIIVLWASLCLCYWLSFCAYNGLYYQLDSLVQNHKPYGLAVALYWIVFAGLCGIFVQVGHIFFKPNSNYNTSTTIWLFNIAAVITLSCTAFEAINQLSYTGLYINTKVAITILWSLCAFVQMWLGMRYKYKTLRIISLSLLGLALCKLFIYDLSAVSQGAKIVAFVVLGIVLLVLSFLYQKLKKILFEDDEKNDV
jgi:uncharacterized membrane protein